MKGKLLPERLFESELGSEDSLRAGHLLGLKGGLGDFKRIDRLTPLSPLDVEFVKRRNVLLLSRFPSLFATESNILAGNGENTFGIELERRREELLSPPRVLGFQSKLFLPLLAVVDVFAEIARPLVVHFVYLQNPLFGCSSGCRFVFEYV